MVKKLSIDNPTVSNIVFYPRKTPIPTKLDSNIKVLRFNIEKNIIIGGFFYVNDPNLPTILLFHGNGEIAADYKYTLNFFFQCGVNLSVMDFRGYGFSTGEPFYTSLIKDALPIYNKFYKWIKKNNFNDSIFILGRSLGSICTSEIGSHNPDSLNGVIFESGFASIYDMMTGLFGVDGPEITPEFLSDYSNDTRIRKFKKPTLVIHGTNDLVIPSYQGRLIYDNIPEGTEKRLVMINKAGHNDISYYEDEYIIPLTEFINKNK